MSDRRDALLAYGYRHDEDLADHTRWPDAAPVGRGQQQTYLYATAAVHQGRRVRDRIRTAQDQAAQAVTTQEEDGTDWNRVEKINADIAAATAAAQTRLSAPLPWENPAALAGVLADGLGWHEELDEARYVTERIGNVWAREWGVVVDAAHLQVGIDPAIDAERAQTDEEVAALWRRELRAAEIATARTSDPQVRSALDTWVGHVLDDDPRAHIADAAQRRDALGAAFDQAGFAGPERASVEFVVDYLRGNVTGTDLLAAPVEVDPGEEVRSRVPQLLQDWEYDRDNAAALTREIAVMTPADQDKMREVGRALVAGEHPDKQVWPGYTARGDLEERIGTYADASYDTATDAEFLVTADLSDEERARIGLDDDIAERIEHMATLRDELVTTINADKGLADIEKIHALAVLADLDAGHIYYRDRLPELMWADERTRREVDADRLAEPAADLASDMRDSVVDVVERLGVSNGYQAEIRAVASSLSYAVGTVAEGSSPDPDGGAAFYRDERTKLGRALLAAEVPVESREQIRGVIDTAARSARELGTAATERGKAWDAKTTAVCEVRDDRLAQHQAALGGRPRIGTRDRAPRPAATEHPAPARSTATRRQHTAEVER